MFQGSWDFIIRLTLCIGTIKVTKKMDVDTPASPGTSTTPHAQELHALANEARLAIDNANRAAQVAQERSNRAEAEALTVRQQAEQTYANLRAQYEQEIAAAIASARASSAASAETAAATMAAGSTASNLGQTRLEKPQRFSGEKKRDAAPLHTWLFTVESYLTMTKQPCEMWARVAGTFLEGSAQLWHECRFKADNTDMSNWASFVADITAQFEPINGNKAARDVLARLTQRASAQQYCTEFMHQFLQITDMGAADAIDRFVRGLKPAIRVQVDLLEPNTLEEAMKVAERYDVLSWRADQAKRWDGRRPPPYRPLDIQPMNSWAQVAAQPSPMEVGSLAANRRAPPVPRVGFPRPRLTPAGSRLQATSNVCWNCNRPGHMANNCPERKSTGNARRAPPGFGSAGRR